MYGGAGTQTTTLESRCLFIQQGIKPYQIMAVTFTNKAANELKERVERSIGVAGQVLEHFTRSLCVF